MTNTAEVTAAQTKLDYLLEVQAAWTARTSPGTHGGAFDLNNAEPITADERLNGQISNILSGAVMDARRELNLAKYGQEMEPLTVRYPGK